MDTDVKCIAFAVLLAELFGVVLFGLYQYQAHNRTWGLRLILWVVGLVLLVGVCLQFNSLLLPVWLGGGSLVAYAVGWRYLGRRTVGWRRHLVRALAFALCLGPLAGIPGRNLSVERSLEMWLHLDLGAAQVLGRCLYGLPGLYLIGALAFIASVVKQALDDETLPTRAVRWTAGVVLLGLLPVFNWYVAGFCSMHEAVKMGRVAMVRYIRFSRPGSIEAREHWSKGNPDAWLEFGGTPLFAATGAPMVRYLLGAGACVHARKSREGETPLFLAAWRGATESMRLLLAAGAEVNAKSNFGETPLHKAAIEGQAEALRLLLDAGAHVNERDNHGDTALDVARSDECRELLRQAGGKTENELDHWTPLHKAAWKGAAQEIRDLLAAGADVNAKGADGRTPLHLSAEGCSAETVRLLLAPGADVNAKTSDGQTPLHRAAGRGNAEAIPLLLTAGAEINAKDRRGRTPLYWAAVYGHAEAIRVLLAADAEVNERDIDGQTALDRADNDACRTLLRAAGGKTGAELDAEKAKPAHEPVKPEPGQ